MFFINIIRAFHLRTFQGVGRPWMLAVWLLFVWVAHVIAMMGLEGMSFNDANWLTWTTLVTVGYGDLSAKTALGRIATMVLLYAGGIFVLATSVSVLLERKAEMTALKLSGKWRWNLSNHILVVSPFGHETEDFFINLFREITKNSGWEESQFQIITPAFDTLPDSLKAMGVVHYRGTGKQAELEACDYNKAQMVAVLGDSRDTASDALVFDIVSRIHPDIRVIAECNDDASRERFYRTGANTVLRPMRGYPEMLARAVVSPGCEHIIEEIFSSNGARIISVPTDSKKPLALSETAYNLLTNNLGSIVGAGDLDRTTVAPTGERINCSALFVLAPQNVQAHDITKNLAYY